MNKRLRLLLLVMRTPFLRRYLAIALAAVLASGAGGCQRKAQGVVDVVVIGGEPKLADPQQARLDPAQSVLMSTIAQGLVRFDANGHIEPGLAETWNVSDDGLSYIFRLANANWPNGRKISAEQVSRMLRKLIARSSRDALTDAFGDVQEVVAMTDRVIEIRLKEPRPHLLQLLAQPEMGLVYDGLGSGPFAIDHSNSRGGTLRLAREIVSIDGDQSRRDELNLRGATARSAVQAFVSGTADLVLGGTFTDLPFAQGSKLPRRGLQFDPAVGLFGLVPARTDGPLANPEFRRILSQSLDRESWIAALSVPGLIPRATVLEPKLDNVPDPLPPQWTATPLVDRRPALAAAVRKLLRDGDPPIRVALPEGPGADLLFGRLAQDWGAIGIKVERVSAGKLADLRLIDEVAPSTSAAWFVRHFRCTVAPICDTTVDEMLINARETVLPAQRSALLAEASRQIDSLQLFIPLAAPIRWSLVSARISGFAGNRFAVHTLTDLEQRLDQTGE